MRFLKFFPLKIKKKRKFIFYVCVGLHVCKCTACMPHTGAQHKSLRSLRTVVAGGCEMPRGRWEENLGPVQELQVLLTAVSSLGPRIFLLTDALL